MKFRDFLQLFRLKPLLAWSGMSVLVAGVLLYHVYGFISNLFWVGVFLLVIVQGLIAHIVNDLADFNVDMAANIEESGRSEKLLIKGKATSREFYSLFFWFSLLYILISAFLAFEVGLFILVLVSIGYWLAIFYSFSPRLGWRPFAEFTVVLPVIVMAVVGLYYLGSGGVITKTILKDGIGLGFLVMGTFICSRLVDVDVDSKMGKNTTSVWLLKNFKSNGLSTVFSTGYSLIGILILFSGVYLVLSAIVIGIFYVLLLNVEIENGVKQLGKFRKWNFYLVIGLIVFWSVMVLW